MRDFLEMLGQLANQPDAVTVEYQAVDSLHKLILDELPYGQIDPNGLVQGLIEIDGPAQNPPNNRRPLQWHFGGMPLEVCKAVRIQYAYQKYLDGQQLDATGSLFIGYELADSYTANPIGVNARLAGLGLAPGSPREVAARAAQAAFLNARANNSAARAAALAPSVPPASVAAAIAQLRTTVSNSPWQVKRLAKYIDAANFDPFVQEQWPFTGTVGGYSPDPRNPLKVNPPPTPLSLMLGDPVAPSDLPRVRIEFDGPARQYNSKNSFPFTNQSLFNDPSGIYQKLIWWYFGGSPYRITKAMRMYYQDPLLPGWLLIGYQGPTMP
jgi:hypothetical protein